MPRFPEDGVIFIHVPKTGGTFIEKSIFKLGDNDYDRWTGVEKRTGINYIHKKFINMAARVDLSNYSFIFGFVRNPYDRMVSEYMYHSVYYIANTFADFVRSVHKYFKLKERNVVKPDVNHLACITLYEHHLVSQFDYYTLDKQTLDPRIKIYHYESFNEAIRDIVIKPEIRSIIRANNVYKIDINKRMNQSEHTHYSDYYDDETRELVYDIYKIDFEMFGYER